MLSDGCTALSSVDSKTDGHADGFVKAGIGKLCGLTGLLHVLACTGNVHLQLHSSQPDWPMRAGCA